MITNGKGRVSMIYTVTLNPSVDYVMKVDHFQLGGLNRTSWDEKFPGGKGINVSRVLKRHGVSSKVLGFIGGFTGDYIETFLSEEEIETDFVKIKEDTRINIKLHTDDETEINGTGPYVKAEEISEFLHKLDFLRKGDIIVLAGSMPRSVPLSIYHDIIHICEEKNVSIIADLSGEVLKQISPSAKLFLMKPNHYELGELFGVRIQGIEDAYIYGQKLVEKNIENVIVSLAGEGALFLTKEVSYFASVPEGAVKNSAGAGDSVVAGFLSGFVNGKTKKEAFRLGVASGTATAFSIELCTSEEATKLMKEIKITRL